MSNLPEAAPIGRRVRIASGTVILVRAVRWQNGPRRRELGSGMGFACHVVVVVLIEGVVAINAGRVRRRGVPGSVKIIK
jgi:hypothetical protein